jgi:hypothetical protein
VVLVIGLGGAAALVVQLRCVDSAREAARLAARGDERAALEATRLVGPPGADLQLRREGDLVIARVSANPAAWLRVRVEAEAVAVVEPGG